MLQWTQTGGGATPLDYPVVIDLETSDPPPEEIEIEKMFAATGNLKDPAKIANKKENLKLAVTDSAPIWCVGIETLSGFTVVAQAVLSEEEKAVCQALGWAVYLIKTEQELLTMYRLLLNTLPVNTRLIAAGDFDLHKSRFRYVRHDLEVPGQLFSFAYSDLMREWQHYSGSDKIFTSVKEMALKLGLAYDLAMDGGEIPEAIKTGEHFQVMMKNRMDCAVEFQIAKRLLRGKIQC